MVKCPCCGLEMVEKAGRVPVLHVPFVGQTKKTFNAKFKFGRFFECCGKKYVVGLALIDVSDGVRGQAF